MGIFDRSNGVPPSGQDLYWHDRLPRDVGGGGGGGGLGKGCIIALIVIAVLIAVWIGWIDGTSR